MTGCGSAEQGTSIFLFSCLFFQPPAAESKEERLVSSWAFQSSLVWGQCSVRPLGARVFDGLGASMGRTKRDEPCPPPPRLSLRRPPNSLVVVVFRWVRRAERKCALLAPPPPCALPWRHKRLFIREHQPQPWHQVTPSCCAMCPVFCFCLRTGRHGLEPLHAHGRDDPHDLRAVRRKVCFVCFLYLFVCLFVVFSFFLIRGALIQSTVISAATTM